LAWRRVSQLYDLPQALDYAGHLTLRLGRLRQFKQKPLFAFQEAQLKPAEQIIGQRLGIGNLRIARPAAWLKPCVAELVAQDTQRDKPRTPRTQETGPRLSQCLPAKMVSAAVKPPALADATVCPARLVLVR
jgi:hypothetical protein